ncbi:hypothetical protein NDU88_006337 [Pleurodeles waltl]|uniref:Uncharacterized protein n=1 Tax=Pleurodeles waltl TaxID=8319 RepID=A0AAV7N0N3_PLEWA|nr:hypothetical protein NDU88_006337 [Pleurodeles waltl]
MAARSGCSSPLPRPRTPPPPSSLISAFFSRRGLLERPVSRKRPSGRGFQWFVQLVPARSPLTYTPIQSLNVVRHAWCELWTEHRRGGGAAGLIHRMVQGHALSVSVSPALWRCKQVGFS